MSHRNPKNTELERHEILRMSNEESNRITRSCIESALILLMKDQPFEEISITAIVKRAGVSRTAYYRNYDSKEDILRSMMKEIINEIMGAMNLHHPVQNNHAYWLAMFHTLGQHREGLHVLLKANYGDDILRQVQAVRLHADTGNDVSGGYKAAFWSGAVYGITARWISGGTRETPEEMAAVCYSIMNEAGGPCR